LGAALPPPKPVVVPQLIAPNGQLSDNHSTTSSMILREIRYPLKNGGVAATDIRLLFAGFYNLSNTPGEQPLKNAITWKAALEKTSPSFATVASRGGNTTFTNAPDTTQAGGFFLTEALGISLAAGETFNAQLEHRTTAGSYILNLVRPFTALQNFTSATLTSGHAGTAGTWTATGDEGVSTIQAVIPGIIGMPAYNYPAVVIFGDSIQYGTGDARDANNSVGYVQRGLYTGGIGGNPVPSINLSKPGEKASDIANGGGTLRLTALKYASDVITDYLTNDIAASNSYATCIANLQAVWNLFKAYGVRVTQVLIMPRTTSTDSWATAANQTPVAGFESGGVRDQVNAFIISKVADGTIAGYIDPNPVVEDPANHGKWITNGTASYPTADGIHPSAALHALVAPLVTTWAQGLVWSPSANRFF
jgi:lysophospholipase L1-like esterase